MIPRVLVIVAWFSTVCIAQIPQQTLRPAQENAPQTGSSSTPYRLSIGAYILAKAGVNTAVAKGRMTDVNINSLPDFGVSVFAPFQAGGRLGIGLDLGYATYTYINKPLTAANDDNTIVEQYSYVNVFPHLNLSGIVFGVNLGLSPRGHGKSQSGRTMPLTTDPNRTELSSDELSTLVEVRLGGNFPIWEHSTGHLNLYLMAGYALSRVYSDYKTYRYSWDDNISPSASNNPRPASLAVGLAYYFRVPLTQ